MDNIKVLYSEEVVEKKIKELADCINKDYEGKEIVVIGILTGGVYFMTRLTQMITVPVEIDFIKASSYNDGTESCGVVTILKDTDIDIANRHVLVVEDIIDTGRTLTKLFEILKERKPASLKLCTLLDKKERRVPEATVGVDYNGFVIANEFVVGYGLDHAQKYRNLPYIGVVES